MNRKDIFVYLDHRSDTVPHPIGVLSVQMIRGKELFSFAFDEDFLKRRSVFSLDPDLQFYAGPQFTTIFQISRVLGK